MKELTVEAIAQILNARIAGAPGRSPVTGISTDSRAVRAGDCFFAITGENFDGHDYVAKAFDQGAACAVVDHVVEARGPMLVVGATANTDAGRHGGLPLHGTVEALGTLARAYRQSQAFKVVAITGSVGKTTTRQIVHHVLSRRFRTHQAKKNFNNTIGLPLTLLDARPDDEMIVAELGANALGEIAYLTGIALPDVAVVTNAHPAHLAGFGSLETIIAEKTAIAQGLGDDGAFIVNGDIEALAAACRAGGRAFKTFGRSAGCDYRAEQVVYNALTSTFKIGGQEIHLPLPGPGNVDNAVAAWAVCEQFDLTLAEFAEALPSLTGVAMRAEPLQIGTFTVLNDCYNANPASMNNALAMLSHLRATGDDSRRLVFVCGAMAELGDQTEPLHAELGRAVAEAGVDLLLTVGEATKTTARAAKAAAEGLRTEHFDDTNALCDHLAHFLCDYDIMLVKGSRTAHLEDVVEKLKTVSRVPCSGPQDTMGGARTTGFGQG